MGCSKLAHMFGSQRSRSHAVRHPHALRSIIRWQHAAAVVSVLLVTTSACASSPNAHPGGSEGGGPAVEFVPALAASFNGTIPQANASRDCGRNNYGFLAEVPKVGLGNIKVTKHYGPIIKLADGMPKQMEASGVLKDASGGASDLPFDHSFGGDYSMDIQVDSQYTKLGQYAGAKPTSTNGILHVEIQQGEMPHSESSVSDPLGRHLPGGVTWPAYAHSVEQPGTFVAGFLPRTGDRIAAEGDWIIDCGHTDFHTELHELTFIAFGSDSGGAAVVHAFANPYLPSELYNQNASLAGQVGKPGSMALSSSAPLVPGYLENTVLGLLNSKAANPPPIRIPMLVEASRVAPSPFEVCAPPGSKGALHVSYAFDVRPGVSVAESIGSSPGCATFHAAFTGSYRPADPLGQTLCPVPWSWLNAEASQQIGQKLDLQSLIVKTVDKLLPSAVGRIAAALSHAPEVDCFSPLLSSIGPVVDGSHAVTPVAGQILPVAGWAKVYRTG